MTHLCSRSITALSAGEETDVNRETTVFELAGQDRAGLLADITDHISANGCHVHSAAVSLRSHCSQHQALTALFKQHLQEFPSGLLRQDFSPTRIS